jgi:transcriptional regulator with XRE-family HTH domain
MGVDGALVLRTTLKQKGMSQISLAHSLGVCQQAVNKWATGARKPSGAWRKALELVLGIPEDTWLTDDESEALSRIQSSR